VLDNGHVVIVKALGKAILLTILSMEGPGRGHSVDSFVNGRRLGEAILLTILSTESPGKGHSVDDFVNENPWERPFC
jgi:hypothetical protein